MMDVVICFLSVGGALLATVAICMIESAGAKRREWFRVEIGKAKARVDYLREEGDVQSYALAIKELETLRRAAAGMGVDAE